MDHYNMTYVGEDQAFYTYPIHKDDIALMPDKEKIYSEIENLPKELSPVDFEDYWKNSVGETLYNKFINTYSKKMWKVKNNKQLDEFTFSMKNKANDALKTGPKKCFDGKKRIFYPTAYEGYNSYFDACVEGCEVIYHANVETFDIENKRVRVDEKWYGGDIVISTVSPDIVFDYCYGELPYMGRDFLPIILPIERVTPEPYFFMHYANDEPYTRIFEYKLLTRYQSPHTMLGVEFPSTNNKLYPYPVIAEINKAKKYISMMPEGVFSIGRNGNYHYDNMDVVIKHCFEIMENI